MMKNNIFIISISIIILISCDIKTDLTDLFNKDDNKTNSNNIKNGIPVSGLIGEWLFNNDLFSPSNQVTDTSSYNNHGSRFGSDTKPSLCPDRLGIPGKAYFFDASPSSYISIPGNIPLNSTDSLSISFWMYLQDGITATHFPIQKDNVFYIQINNTAGVPNDVTFTLNAASQNITQGGLQEDHWYFFAAIFDNTNNDMRIYVNDLVSAVNLLPVQTQPNINNLTNNTNSARIGNSFAFFYYFRGYLDNIRIYNRALTQSEILALYNDPD